MQAPTDPAGNVRQTLVLAGLLCALLLASYWPALHGELIWNDRDYVTRADLRSLEGLGRIWLQPGSTEQYYPLLHSSFWLQCRLWGEDPLGYHLVTLALHAGAAVLFGLLLRSLAVSGAWLAAFLFALHPVHVQSVAWITEQKNTLSLVFYLAAALAYLRFDATRRPGTYVLGLVLFVLSLLCKTMTATLPAALLVVLWWKRGRLDWRRDVAALLPWLMLGAAAGLFTAWVEQHYVGARGENFQLPLLERGLVAGRALWFYLGQIVWPRSLNFVYPRWTPDATAWWQWLFPLAALALAAGLWCLRGRTRAPLAVFLLFAGSAFPALGFVNLYGALYSWVWDHWQYLPDLAPLALVGAGLARFGTFSDGRWRPAGLALAGLLVAGLGALSWRHAGTFRNEETLYRVTLARNPSAWMAHNNLASLLAAQPDRETEARGHYEQALLLRPEHINARINLANLLAKNPARQAEARAQYEQALQSKPDHAEAHNYLAKLLAASPEGDRVEALAHYETALRLKPDYASAHNNLALLLATWPGRETEAATHYETALRLKPDFAEAHNNLANLLVATPTHQARAIRHYQRALQIDPDFPQAHNNLANVLAPIPERQPEALHHYATALRLKPDYAEAHNNLGLLLLKLPERRAEALPHFIEAIRLNSGYVDARLNAAGLLSNLPGRAPEAIDQYQEILRLRPDFPRVHAILAILHARLGQIPAARTHAEAALRLEPDNVEARQTLAYLQSLEPSVPGR